jgi:hypothetical protein
LVFLSVQAQTFDVGNRQDPRSTDWMEIESSQFRVIYPKGLKQEAGRVLYVLDRTYQDNQADLDDEVDKVDVILRSNQVISNGFVTLGPRRSEWFITPYMDTNLGAGYWTDLLAIHEYRHVAQYDAFLNYGSQGIYFFMGEAGWSLSLLWGSTSWFHEGDAVVSETLHTPYGRGRLPEFESQFKALVMQEPDYDLDKIFLRSYHDYIPNHYVIGFYLMSYIRDRYGEDSIANIVQYAGGVLYNPYAFHRAVYHETGQTLDELYKEMRNYFGAMYMNKLKEFPPGPVSMLTQKPNDTFEDYRYVWPYKDGVVAYKKAFNDPGSLVFIKNKEVDHLKTLGSITSSGPKKCGDLLTWSELTVDHRWGYQNYSEIIEYNLEKNSRDVLTNRGKFFGPNYSDDCQEIVAIEVTAKNQKNVILLNRKTNKIYKRIPTPKNVQYFHPAWIPGTRDIVVVKKDNKLGLVSLVRLNTATAKETTLIKPSVHVISDPFVVNNTVYFRWDYNGVDNIFSYNLRNGRTLRKTQSPFGAYNPVVKGSRLYYSDYTSRGAQVVSTSLSSISKQPKENEASLKWGERVAKKYGNEDLLTDLSKNFDSYGNVPEKRVESEFSEWGESFEPHSWLLFPPLGSFMQLQLLSSNLMQDTAFYAEYIYDFVTEYNAATLGVSFNRYYPMFDASISKVRRAELQAGTQDQYEKWDEIEMDFGIKFLADFSSGAYSRSFQLRTFYEVIGVQDRPTALVNRLNNETIQGHGAWMNWNVERAKSFRDFYPRWGFDWDTLAKTGRVGGDNSKGADLFSTRLKLYLPGLSSNHHIVLDGQYEYQNQLQYYFSSPFVYARGYDALFAEHLSRTSFNYTFPLSYADLPIFITYIRRIGLNLFYDASTILADDLSELENNSYGAELLFETGLFRNQNLNFTLGLRYSHRELDDEQEGEFFLATFF